MHWRDSTRGHRHDIRQADEVHAALARRARPFSTCADAMASRAPTSAPAPARPRARPSEPAGPPAPPSEPDRASVPLSEPARAPEPPPRPGPNTVRGPNLNAARVSGVVEAIEDLKREMRKDKEESAKREKVMYGAIKLLQAKLAAAEARVAALMDYLEIEEEGREEEDYQEQGEVREETTGAPEAQRNGPTEEQIKRSLEASQSVSIKVCRQSNVREVSDVVGLYAC